MWGIHTLQNLSRPFSQVPISLMDSDPQLGCLGNFFNSIRLRRIKPARPKSSSQSYISRTTSITPPGERKGLLAAIESQDSNLAVCLDAGQQNLKEGIQYFSPYCDYSCSPPSEWWSSIEPRPPSYFAKDPDNDISATIERKLDELSPDLRDLSLKIHGITYSSPSYDYKAYYSQKNIYIGHPELQFQERFITSFLRLQRAMWLN